MPLRLLFFRFVCYNGIGSYRNALKGRKLKTVRCLFALFFAISWVGACAQQTTKDSLPEIPSWLDHTEREALGQAGAYLARGKFDQAKARISEIATRPTALVFIDYAPVPIYYRAKYRQAAAQAVAAWNKALNGSIQFKLSTSQEGADLVILFQRSIATPIGPSVEWPCIYSEITFGDSARSTVRTCEALVAVNVSNRGYAHEVYDIVHLVAQAIGCYIGLPATHNSADIMGPDSHDATLAQAPSPGDIARAKQIQS